MVLVKRGFRDLVLIALFVGLGVEFGAMASKICMNVSCGTSNTHEWKNGWPLRSGGFAHLCYKCG